MNRQFPKRLSVVMGALATMALCGYARQPERGYRGFVEWTNRIFHKTQASTWDGTNYTWSETFYNPGIATSHGYQFNPWLYVGAGIDFSLDDIKYIGFDNGHHYDISSNMVSLFIHGRTDLQFGKYTPFADVRIGWNACTHGTVYFSPTIGYRFNWGRKLGINLGLGYSLDAYRMEEWTIETTPEGYHIAVPTGEHLNWNRSSFTFRVGIDF